MSHEARADSNMIKISRHICFLLRHKPEAAGLTVDEHGYAKVEELIAAVSKRYTLDIDFLEQIVAEDDKNRYSFSPDKTRIRCNQGHSIAVDVELEEQEPPEFLWHGTATKYLTGIEEKGLISKSRLYVHLSPDYETAVKVGKRHGTPIVFRVQAHQMFLDGYTFLDPSIMSILLTMFRFVIYPKCSNRESY